MRLKIFIPLLLSLYIVNCTLYIHAQPDTTKPQTNYRRTDPNNPPPTTSYTQLLKEQVFPLGYGTNHLGKVNSGTGTWTELNPKVPRVTYIGLDFINPDTGWTCGGSGAIIKTTNGGDDWTISETPVTNLLLKIHSYNGQVVICTGYDGLILRSSDGGETFEQIVSGVGSGTDLWGVQMVNDTLGWVCRLNQTLLKTTDAGISWQMVTTGLNQNYWSLNFLNEQYGMIACGGGIILKTTDGGNGWAITQSGDERALYTIDIIDALHIAAAGFDGKNVYSDDGGTTWVQNTDVPAFSAINWIDFINTDTGYCVRDVYDIAKTTNRGQNWFNPNTEVVSEWHIQLLDDGTGYSCGEEVGGSYALNFFKRTNGLENWSNIFLNDNFSDVFFINEQKGFAISSSGLSAPSGLYKTTDGGNNWERVAGAPDGVDLLFLDSLTGFVGASNAIYKTTDGGDSWYATQGTTGAGKIFFIKETKGWAIHSGTIYITTDTGENWTVQHTLPADSYTGIFFIDSLNGWATSRYIWQTTDGGVNWVERTDIPAVFSKDIYFTNIDIGFIIEFLNLYKTTNSGNSWNVQLSSPYIIRSFGWLDSQRGFIIGDGVYETNDSGETWNEIISLRNIGLRNFHSPKNYIGYSTGYQGLIYKYFDSSYVPVELVFFKGELISDEIILTWITASELNNYGFEVQKSFDKETWEKIGFVIGKGTSTEISYYSFTHSILKSGKSYYRLKQVDYDGTYKYSEVIEVEASTPKEFSLKQNFPNPFNPSTTINFTIPEKSFVTLKIYDMLGREVAELVNEELETGSFEKTFEASSFSSGVYIYRITTMKDGKILFNESKQMLMIK
ncbi:MAG: T9SS type A sorting domain-containing protein [Ignavibacteriales bacterium]|nr:T9SS type A sorting domain-containing protein [Ignavibacteriales bacterium]